MKVHPKNSAYTKKYNRQLILRILRKESVSRAELARRTGLTRAAVSIITDELIKGGLIIESGAGEADYGRKPVLLDINPKRYYSIGLNISRDGYTLGFVDLKGAMIKKVKLDLSMAKSAHEALDDIVERIIEIIDKLELPSDRVLGLGISAPGPLDVYKGTILNPPNFDMWRNVAVVDILRNKLPYDIYLENNSAALAIAEKNYGKGIGLHNFMLMVVDTGIGAGIIIDDKLYRGVGGFGSEIGHTSIDINGDKCSCGNRGCVELYASIPAIIKYARKYDKCLMSWDDIVNGALAGNELCKKVMDKEAQYLSTCIVNSVNVLELEAVILTGYISYKPEMLLNMINKYVNESHITRNLRDVDIYISSIQQDADVLAAATIVIERFFS